MRVCVCVFVKGKEINILTAVIALESLQSYKFWIHSSLFYNIKFDSNFTLRCFG